MKEKGSGFCHVGKKTAPQNPIAPKSSVSVPQS